MTLRRLPGSSRGLAHWKQQFVGDKAIEMSLKALCKRSGTNQQAHLQVSLLSRLGEVCGRDKDCLSVDHDALGMHASSFCRISRERSGIEINLGKRPLLRPFSVAESVRRPGRPTEYADFAGRSGFS